MIVRPTGLVGPAVQRHQCRFGDAGEDAGVGFVVSGAVHWGKFTHARVAERPGIACRPSPADIRVTKVPTSGSLRCGITEDPVDDIEGAIGVVGHPHIVGDDDRGGGAGTDLGHDEFHDLFAELGVER